MNGTISQQQRNPYAQMQPQGFQTSTQQAQAAPNSSAGGQALQIAPVSAEGSISNCGATMRL
jgi:hypothetical protein